MAINSYYYIHGRGRAVGRRGRSAAGPDVQRGRVAGPVGVLGGVGGVRTVVGRRVGVPAVLALWGCGWLWGGPAAWCGIGAGRRVLGPAVDRGGRWRCLVHTCWICCRRRCALCLVASCAAAGGFSPLSCRYRVARFQCPCGGFCGANAPGVSLPTTETNKKSISSFKKISKK